jgi:methionine aminotransferase
METAPEYLETLSPFYEKKRDHFCNLVKNSGFKFQPAAGTFFQLLDYSEISKENDADFARRLTKEIGVASIPISVFYESPPDEQKLRFCFGKNDDILEEAAIKLCEL